MKTLTFLLLTFVITSVFAKYTQTCEVRYETESGWSKAYTVDVSFLTGSELNTATNTFKNSSFSTYAVVFWSQGEASVIKLSPMLLCGAEVDKSCITNTLGDLKGPDQDGDEWKICLSNFCF